MWMLRLINMTLCYKTSAPYFTPSHWRWRVQSEYTLTHKCNIINKEHFKAIWSQTIYVSLWYTQFRKTACIERESPSFMQWHRVRFTLCYIECIALTTAVPFNTGHPSAVSRSWQLKVARQVFSSFKVPLTFRYSWKRLRKRPSKNLIKFSQVYIAFVFAVCSMFWKEEYILIKCLNIWNAL